MFKISSRLCAVKKAGATVAAAALIGTGIAAPASAYPGGPWFMKDMPYVTTAKWASNTPITIGDLADPDVFQESGVYYAYGTTMGGRNVPVIKSTDLKNWTTNSAYEPRKSPAGRTPQNGGDSWYNDSLALPGTWAKQMPDCQGNSDGAKHARATQGCYEIWAPSVEKAGNGKYVMAYVAPMTYSGSTVTRRCIGIATSTKPTGPFYDDRSQPVQCDSDPAGSLDPDIYKEGNKLYLYWKNEGINDKEGLHPTRIHVRELNSSTGNTFAAGSSDKALLTTQQVAGVGIKNRNGETWEESLIENPSMVMWGGKHYLFYSANQYSTLNYREGYAECDSATSNCHRVSHTPLLSTNTAVGTGGPGGGSAFVDKTGKLRLAYAAWRGDRAGYDNCTAQQRVVFRLNQWVREDACTTNQRFLHIGTVEKKGNLLAVTKKTEYAWAASNKYPQAVSFKDISNSQFKTEIQWLAATGISTGWSDNTYRYSQNVERGAMAQFLYRLAGSPMDNYTYNTKNRAASQALLNKCAPYEFKDVKFGHAAYKEICWLRMEGITTGFKEDNTFRSGEAINRDAMAAFMYRLTGQNSSATSTRFSDVPTGRQFNKEITWLASSGITTGYPNGTFKPGTPVSRDAMAAFMYRLTQKAPLIADRYSNL